MLVDGNNFIRHHLKQEIAFAAGKIGITELNLLYCYYGLIHGYPLIPHLKHEVENIAGLFPYTEKTVIQFAEKLLSLLPTIDLIPIWNTVIPEFEKYIFNKYAPSSYKTKLEHLEPYFSDKPWTAYLEGKTVLVFSPFADSIKTNYPNLNKIWNGKITNNFELKVYKYPFALPISDNCSYNTSEEVYEHYLNILHNETFDVGIFGTGYTSLLYTLEAKKMNKCAIHLGGSTQIFFGIKGQRWKEIPRFANIFNEYWTESFDHERPKQLNLVEGGCYW